MDLFTATLGTHLYRFAFKLFLYGYFYFVSYWLILVFAQQWGVWEQKSQTEDEGDDYLWVSAIFIPMAVQLFHSGLQFIGSTTIKAAFSAIFSTLAVYVATLAVVGKLILWKITSDLCGEESIRQRYVNETDSKYGACNFTYDVNFIPTTHEPLAEFIVLIIIATFLTRKCLLLRLLMSEVFHTKNSFLHDFYRYNLVKAFYYDGKDIKMSKLPKSPVFLVNVSTSN